MATTCVGSWEKHLAHQYELMKRATYYQPRVFEREELVDDFDKDRIMLGVEKEKYTPAFRRQLQEYREDVQRLHENGQGDTVNTVRYWLANRKRWPELTHVAAYWVTVAVSNIGAERVFAIMRAIMHNNRGAASAGTWRKELLLRCNYAILLRMLTAAVNEFKSKY